MKTSIELIVFDMAGTTVYDPGAVNDCLRFALFDFDVGVDAPAVNAVMGLPKRESIRLLLEQFQYVNLLPRIEEIHERFAARMRHFYATDPNVREIAGAADVFRELRNAGIKVALNTGFSRDIAQLILDRLGWERDWSIDASICSDEVARGRPHPDMIRELMRRFGVTDSAHVAKVGDTPADLEEGASAGCGWNIGVTGGTHSRTEMQRFPHTHLIETVAELPAVIFAESH